MSDSYLIELKPTLSTWGADVLCNGVKIREIRLKSTRQGALDEATAAIRDMKLPATIAVDDDPPEVETEDEACPTKASGPDNLDWITVPTNRWAPMTRTKASDPDNLDWITIPKEAPKPIERTLEQKLDEVSSNFEALRHQMNISSDFKTLRRLMDRLEGRTPDRNHIPGCPGRYLSPLADATTPRDRRALQNVCQAISDLLPQGYRVHYIHDRVPATRRKMDAYSTISPKGGKTTAQIHTEAAYSSTAETVVGQPHREIVTEATVNCHPDATYNKQVGRALALGRALEKSGLLS